MLRRTNGGFTLIELMMTVAILVILISIAVPSYREMVSNNCAITYNNALISNLQLARSEAAKRRDTIFVTALNSSDAANEWGPGMRVWQDLNNNNAYNAGTDLNIRETELSCGSTTIDETGNRSEFTYDSDGGVNVAGSFDICDDRSGETGNSVAISVTGRPSSSSLTCP